MMLSHADLPSHIPCRKKFFHACIYAAGSNCFFLANYFFAGLAILIFRKIENEDECGKPAVIPSPQSGLCLPTGELGYFLAIRI